MQILDITEWFRLADQDYITAKKNTRHHPKPLEIICYLCAQSVEKYLKAYLEYNDVIPDKIHLLDRLLDKCIDINPIFRNVKKECNFINQYITKVRYPKGPDINETDMKICLKFTEKIRELPVFDEIRTKIEENKKKTNIK